MSYNFKSESEVKEFIHNLGIEYRFGCYSEKNPEVCHLLGDYLEAISKDFPKAAKVYKANCDDHGFARSCSKYGNYTLLGKDGNKEDYKTALEYFHKACNLNDPTGCFSEGLLYVMNNKSNGIEQDTTKGMELLQKACEANNANACYYASGLYISGLKNDKFKEKSETPPSNEFLIQKNMEQAFKFAERGCTLGNMYCCVNLSQMYRKGDGVEKNAELADKYKKMVLDVQEQMDSQQTLTFQEGLS